ncbi:sodium:proton antiporter [Burkholderia diffusa]|uniref:Sodium:proton antiporter n=1 Tax=Burkholderia diffusa TaxID=488732 RepID=A0AAW3P972_9BURK|nr:sodium:proton antiporter [Burkholderia diffusa]KWF32740.1 sodium:proton antiporter [Burkholderia diffusa]KWF38666.1 sodium:proton antiporter [Burkholderia diffusa]KWF46711.1 sodium:proton antiporter [Burkholderia diffusa]KWF50717.1 sodium:proton antiporter [Burkholderia diffusa]
MSSVFAVKLILLSLIAVIGLELLAVRLRLPPAAALLVGGIAIAFAPGLPIVNLDPELVLVIFLPPLLMQGAYLSVLDDFKRNLTGITLLSVGAVAFTTFVVGLALHLVLPALTLPACFALGAIVSPPDAVAAKAILERVALPRRLMVLLEGESLLNDAAGLILYRFAVAATLTGAFSLPHALGSFALLGVGGIAIGIAIGLMVIALLRRLQSPYHVIIATTVAAWVCYLAGDAINVSGVLATVTYGMVLGWHQHELVSASVRIQGTAFWQVVVFLFEALAFILIGLSLRGVVLRLGGADAVLLSFAPAIVTVVSAVVLSRFVWIFATDGLEALARRLFARAHTIFDWRGATIKSWAGMRGVVTLTTALALPESMPGRDLILVASFCVILVTVLIQGTTLGSMIAWLKPIADTRSNTQHLSEPQAWARLEAAQYSAVRAIAFDKNGTLVHPRLFEQYQYRARVSAEHKDAPEVPPGVRYSHYDAVLTAIAAGRLELLRMYRSGLLHDELMHMLERDLDLQEVTALHGRDGG